MKKPKSPTNRIAEHRKARGMTQQQLADAIGSHWITVSKLERGVMRLSDEWRQSIAAVFGIDEWDLVAGARELPIVHMEGRIEEGGKIEGLDEDETGDSFQLSTAYFTNPSYRWLVVSGDALWPLYQDGDRICLLNMDLNEIESVRGRLVVAWYNDKDGNEQVTIGVLERTRGPGVYSIARTGAPPIRDIKPTFLSVVAMAVYWLEQNVTEPIELIPPADLEPI